MSRFAPLLLKNGAAAPIAQLPVVSPDDFASFVACSVSEGGRIAALFGYEPRDGGPLRIVAIIVLRGHLEIAATDVIRGVANSLTPDVPQAHLFEREIAEQWGVVFERHPWPKPVRFQRRSAGAVKDVGLDVGVSQQEAVTDFFSMSGDEVHEVAVGPVHAGVIEPGHFRFQCHGEDVYHLEISLGYQHRGIEAQLVGGPRLRTLHQIETIAGDTTIAHAWAYSLITEALSVVEPSGRASLIRGVALELERLANHVIDIGALAGDVGFLPTLNFCGRLRGDALNTTTTICGNRLGRGWVRPGGVRYDISAAMAESVLKTIDAFERDAEAAVDLLWNSSTVMARFHDTGVVSGEIARDLGLVGVAARASGLERDARADLQSAPYEGYVALGAEKGDVHARAYVRWLEIKRSCALIRGFLHKLPDGDCMAANPPAASTRDSIAVGVVEGWRGEVVHVAITGSGGKFLRYKVVDPSFHNWAGLAMALRGQAISDFPLCNKSFNLSYCGHDL